MNEYDNINLNLNFNTILSYVSTLRPNNSKDKEEQLDKLLFK